MDLVALLTGNNNLENQYLQNDPWFGAARGIAQTQLAAPTNNTEAFLLPFLQQSLAGGMAGYGRNSAAQSAYKDFSSALKGVGYQPSPIADALAGDQIQYGLDEMPDNFSIKAGTPDLLLAMAQQNAKQEAAQKLLEQKQKLELESSPEYLKNLGLQEKFKASGKAIGERIPGGLTQDQQLKLETDITSKLTTGTEAQKVLETQSKAKSVLDALKKDDPIRAATAIYGFAKLLDPEGVVRKEDGTIVANPGGPVGQLASYYNTLIQGGQLTEQTKKAMKEIIPSLINNQYESYDALKSALVGSAKKQGARTDMIGSLPPMEFEPTIPPGYKLQKNKVTGETRVVPQ